MIKYIWIVSNFLPLNPIKIYLLIGYNFKVHARTKAGGANPHSHPYPQLLPLFSARVPQIPTNPMDLFSPRMPVMVSLLYGAFSSNDRSTTLN